MNKGQVSHDYLMIYGVAVAVIVIAVAALYSMGVFDVSNESIYILSDEDWQKEMCSTLCNNIGEDFNYYGVGLNKNLADNRNNYKGEYECYCSRTYLTGDENNTFKIVVVNNYGYILEVVKINESE